MFIIFCSFLVHLVIRFLQGFTEFLSATGMLVVRLELMPARYRNLINGTVSCAWGMGYSIAAAVGYFLADWNYMFLATAFAGLVFRIHIFIFVIESPRFFLVNNDVKTANKTFEALSKLTTAKLDLENVEVVDVGKAEERDQSIKQQLQELIKYPSLLKETLLVMVLCTISKRIGV